MKYHLAVKKNEIMKFTSRYIDLEIILRKVTKTLKDKYCIFLLY